MYPPQGLRKIKNGIKHENRGSPPRFSHNPKVPSSKEFDNDCASMILK
jgi:hypothetical protein